MSASVSGSSRVCLRRTTTLVPQTRSFSSTVNRRKNGALTNFPPTSSPELDSILNNLRENVFLPSHLRAPQKHLVYRKHFQHYLTGEEPVKVELHTVEPGQSIDKQGPKEQILLKPLDKQRDEPAKTPTFNRILELLRGKPDEWIIIPSILREWNISGWRPRSRQVEKLVRMAALEHKIGLIVDCLKRKDTGIRVQTYGIASQLLLGAQQQALDTGLSEIELDKAISRISFVLLAIEDTNHMPIKAERHPRHYPEIYGHALAMLAARRWRWETENTPEKLAVRAEAAEAVTKADTPEVEQTVGEATAAEDVEGETPAEATVEEAAVASHEAYALGAKDINTIERIALQVLDKSENAVLEFDESVHRDCDNFVQQWTPTWFGIQIVDRIQGVNPDIKRRLKAAFDAEIDPAVKRAVEALRKTTDVEEAPEARGTALFGEFGQHLS